MSIQLSDLHGMIMEMVFKSTEVHRVVGEYLARKGYEYSHREGFVSAVLAGEHLTKGRHPTIHVPHPPGRKVFFATSPTRGQEATIRDKIFMPPEIAIVAKPFVEHRLLNQSVANLIWEKADEMIEAVMIAEEALMLKLVQTKAPVKIRKGSKIGRAFLSVIDGLEDDHGAVIVSERTFKELIEDKDFTAKWRPWVAEEWKVQRGNMGLWDDKFIVYSDMKRSPQHRIVCVDEMFAFGDPTRAGHWTDRGGWESEPLSGATEGCPGRGWYIHSSISIALFEKNIAWTHMKR